MDFVRDWVSSIAAVTLIVSLVTALCPKNSAGRTVMLISSLLMTAVLISPLRRIDTAALSRETAIYLREAEKRQRELSVEQENIRESIIEENMRAYILQRAESVDVQCDVEVKCRDGEPYSAHITAKDKAALSEMSEMIAKECGIPQERQSFALDKHTDEKDVE